MELKATQSLHVDYLSNGHICISQHSYELGKIVDIFLTLEQFKAIEKWVNENYLEILGAWNGGVADDSQA
jgi:hypothetical protein